MTYQTDTQKLSTIIRSVLSTVPYWGTPIYTNISADTTEDPIILVTPKGSKESDHAELLNYPKMLIKVRSNDLYVGENLSQIIKNRIHRLNYIINSETGLMTWSVMCLSEPTRSGDRQKAIGRWEWTFDVQLIIQRNNLK